MKKTGLVMLALTLLLSGLAWVWLVDQPEAIRVEQSRIRLLPGDGPQAGYFILHNDTSRMHRLLSASSPVFEHVMLHQTRIENDQARMQALDDGVVINAGDSIEFAPNGMHLMMMRSTQLLEVGDLVPVTLQFNNSQNEVQEITYEFIVVPIAP